MKYIALLLTLLLLGSVQAQKPTSDEIRLLMVVDSSFSMRGKRAATTEIISRLITNGFQHAISPGQKFALWTFNEDVDAKFSPTQPWTPELAPNLARAAEHFLKNRAFEQRTRFEVLMPQIRQLADNLDSMLVLIFTDGEDRIVGTTLDERLNSSAKAIASEERSAKMPIVFVLTLVDGEFTSGTVQRGSRRLSLPQAPTPTPDLAANEAQIKTNEPEPKAAEPPPIVTYTLPPGAKLLTPSPTPRPKLTEPAPAPSEQPSIRPLSANPSQQEVSRSPAISETATTPLASEALSPKPQQPATVASGQEPVLTKPPSLVLSAEQKTEAPVVNPSPAPPSVKIPESASLEAKESGAVKEIAANETATANETPKIAIAPEPEKVEQISAATHTKPFLPKVESGTDAAWPKASPSRPERMPPQAAPIKPPEPKRIQPVSVSPEKGKTTQVAQADSKPKPMATNTAVSKISDKPRIPATQALVEQPLLTTARALIFGGLLAVTALLFFVVLRRRKPTPSLISKSLQSENER
jgi:hypothetical protein